MKLGRIRNRFALYLRGGFVVLGISVLCASWACAQSGPAAPAAASRPNGGWGAAWSPRGDRIAFLASDDGLPDEVWLADPQGASFRCLTRAGADDVAWSPGGRTLSYATTRRGRSERWQIDLDAGQERPLARHPGIPSEAVQTFAPDGKSVAYTLADAKFRDLYVITGAAQATRVTTGFTVGSVAWSPKGDRIAFDCLNPISEGLPQVWLYDLPTKRLAHIGSVGSFAPVWSPRGDALAYSMMYSTEGARVGITRPDLVMRFVPAHPAERTSKTPKPKPKDPGFKASLGGMVKGVLYQGDGMAWSPKGDLLAVVVRRGEEQQVDFVNTRLKVVAYLTPPGLRVRLPVWSPDGTRLAFEAMRKGVSAASEVWTVDIKGKHWQDLTPSHPSYWALSPAAGGRVFFLSNPKGTIRAWAAGGSGGAVFLPGTEGASQVVASPHGDRMVILEPNKISLFSAGGKVLNTLPLSGAVEACWSPQGDRLALGLKRGGREDSIEILSASAAGALTKIASVPGSNPAWRPDGASLAFVRSNLLWRMDADGKHPHALAAVPVAAREEALLLNPAWDPKGERIAFAVTRTAPGAWRQEVWLLPVREGAPAASGPAQPTRIFSEEAASEYALSAARWNALPAWTADGRLLISSDRGGAPQVWSLAPDGSDLRAITPPDSLWPALAANGKTLYFVRPEAPTPLWEVSTNGTDPSPLAWNN